MAEGPLESLRRQIREAEERLKRSEPSEKPPAERERKPDSALRAALEAAREGFIMVDASGGWELANSRLPEWLGYSREEFQNLDLGDVFEAGVVDRLLASFQDWIAGAEPLRNVPCHARGKRGERIALEMSSIAWTDARGDPFAYLVLEDTSARKRLESQLASARSLIDAIMRGGAVAAVQIGRDGLVLEATAAACKELGIDDAALEGTRFADRVAPLSRASFEAAAMRAAEGGAVDLDCRLQTANAGEVGARMALVAVPDPTGTGSRLTALFETAGSEPAAPLASPEWAAYGQMTPALAQELAQLLGSSVKAAADAVRGRTQSAGTAGLRLLQTVERARTALATWGESSAILSADCSERRFADLLRESLDARRAELERWGIEPTLEMADPLAEACPVPASLYPVALHILQSAIEDIREGAGPTRLLIRSQIASGRLEMTLLYELSPLGESAGEAGAPAEQLRIRNVGLRAAQKMLESLGGTLVLENVTATQRAIRMHLSLRAEAERAAPRTMHEGA